MPYLENHSYSLYEDFDVHAYTQHLLKKGEKWTQHMMDKVKYEGGASIKISTITMPSILITRYSYIRMK